MVEISDRLYALASRIDADGTASQIGSADEILEIAKLAAFLEERKAEPVAWTNRHQLEFRHRMTGSMWPDRADQDGSLDAVDIPLYLATPPAPDKVVEAPGWRSMDSAPKDGARIELWHHSDTHSAGGWPVHGSWRDWQPGIFSWRGDSGASIDARAWRPAATAPQTAEESL
ncbi:hypothetical protein [Mesorhizobium sp. ESP-6-2]|uniref:hypothetical protein n=1 Tax=Mesorhizobium sp. ESP-6-2 TaxID=2876625 RepID=UPI001CCA7FF3|nr:hypothetical protein [Mesorhizobium sp. ESP-6-2]MBZ9807640.1 hypothetical protein [Mesorhizobium sp. ESP-6-2]